VSFALTAKQEAAQAAFASDATFIMLFGGGRSGKTALIIRNIIMRALKAPLSRHLVVRFRFNHVKSSIILDTFPKVLALAFPGVAAPISKTDWFAKFANGSEIWFGGLDDKERMEKILGNEYVTIFPNECSQISWDGIQMLITRLAQKVMQVIEGRQSLPMKLRMYFDCNPPSKAHWTFRVFRQKVDPVTRAPLPRPDDYTSVQMNPRDNAENLSPQYLLTLSGMSARMRRRFELGEFSDATPNALFDESLIDRWRVMDGNLPSFVRVVVAVDPSGSGDEDNADNDEIGIVAAALGQDGIGYVIEDVSCKAGPATWGKIATDAFERHSADSVVGETNFGGEMVRQTILTARPRTPFKKVVASRGKVARAEPFSALYEQGKVRHVGILSKLEDELCAMSTTGYTGRGSPNRADAVIWALAELFPQIVAGPKVEKPRRERVPREAGAWMG
jgi:phage terminase large subunit-like protein